MELQYLAFDQVGTTLAVIAIACGFVALVWNAIKAIKEWIASLKKPTDERIHGNESKIEDHERRISHLEECCTEVRGKLESDYQFQQEEKEFNRLMLEAIGSLLRHNIDGNDTQELKDAETRINKYLVDHL